VDSMCDLGVRSARLRRFLLPSIGLFLLMWFRASFRFKVARWPKEQAQVFDTIRLKVNKTSANPVDSGIKNPLVLRICLDGHIFPSGAPFVYSVAVQQKAIKGQSSKTSMNLGYTTLAPALKAPAAW